VANDIGQLLGAQFLVLGSMTMDPTAARMDLRLTNTETGSISNTFKEKGKPDELLALVDSAASKFGSNLKVAPRVVQVVVPIPSIFAYTRGLDYEKRGEKDKAAAMYETALKLFPENAAAKAALDRVQ
jgi:hypothetical protein